MPNIRCIGAILGSIFLLGNLPVPVDPEAASADIVCEAAAIAPIEASLTIPKLTPVVLQIDEPLSSDASLPGQAFALSLAESLVVDGVEILPAGLAGEGEVIHAKKAGGSGSGGELILAASYLGFEGRRIVLRSMKIGQTGGNNIGLVTAIGATPVGVLGMFITGKNTRIEPGTLAGAKLAEDFQVPVPPHGEVGQAPCLEGSD